MRTLTESIRAALIAGSPPFKVYPDVIPESVTTPAVTYHVFFRRSEETLDGSDPRLVNAHIQVDAWADTKGQAEIMGDQIRALMLAASDFTASSSGGFDEYEEETKRYRMMQEFSIWKTVPPPPIDVPLVPDTGGIGVLA